MQMSKMLQPTHPLQLLAGHTVWLLWFCALYAGVSLGCQWFPPSPQQGFWNWISATAGLLSGAILALLLWAAICCWRSFRRQAVRSAGDAQPRPFVAAVAAGLYLLAALATGLVSLTLLLSAPCLQ